MVQKLSQWSKRAGSKLVAVDETVSRSSDAGQDLATVDKRWRVRGRGYCRLPGLQA